MYCGLFNGCGNWHQLHPIGRHLNLVQLAFAGIFQGGKVGLCNSSLALQIAVPGALTCSVAHPASITVQARAAIPSVTTSPTAHKNPMTVRTLIYRLPELVQAFKAYRQQSAPLLSSQNNV